MDPKSLQEVAEGVRGGPPLRVLIVESSATDANRVVRELQRTGRRIDFERVDTTAAMRAALERDWDSSAAAKRS